ncbi:MAG TPA: hypothetical protein RMH99_16720 [Sandaracinaceae bacterium LLY-WYZ-13_1]|nr:hypothetical protein [Sandaracinaceae bacterium LLY-WYZ-13_1]
MTCTVDRFAPALLAAGFLIACDGASSPQNADACPDAVGEPEVQQVVAAASCDGYGEDVTDAAPFDVDGSALRREESWGCGCPTAPSFTMAYEPGSSPLRVRLCYDGAADTCEALCTRELTWDLCGALAAEGEDELAVVDP